MTAHYFGVSFKGDYLKHQEYIVASIAAPVRCTSGHQIVFCNGQFYVQPNHSCFVWFGFEIILCLLGWPLPV